MANLERAYELHLQGPIFEAIESQYVIIASKIIRSNRLYNVVVSVNNVDQICKMKLILKGPELQLVKIVDVPIRTAVNVGFEIPKNMHHGTYNLIVEGVAGLIFTKIMIIYFSKQQSVFIQTNKVKYKPGDLVQFRAIFLDHDLRPTNPDGVSIIITDAEKNRIKYFRNVKLTKGVISEKLQLSEFPSWGTWSIEVNIKGEQKKLKEFDVEEYVLPKFQIKIDVPGNQSVLDEKFGFTLTANYTFDKSVNGKATIKICTKFGMENELWNTETTQEKSIDLRGKAYIEFDMNEIKPKSGFKIFDVKSEITAIVEEEITGNHQTEVWEVTLLSDSFHICDPRMIIHSDVPNQKIIYPIKVYERGGLSVMNDDKNPVKLTIGRRHRMQSFIKDGVANFNINLQDIPLSLYVSYRTSFSGHYINMFHGKGLEVLTHNSDCRGIQIGESVEIQFNSDEILTHLTYVIIARGNILHSAFIDLAGRNAKSHKWNINATFEMAPKAVIFLYYCSGKVWKFAETSFIMETCFLNKISIDVPKHAQPGEDVEIHIKTDRDSYVGLMAVEQSVAFLKAENDFNKDVIWSSLGQYEYELPIGIVYDFIVITNNYKNEYFDENPYQIFTDNKKSLKGPRIRKGFPECWFYEDFPNSEDGNLTITKKMPDTITSWIISGFSLNSETGFTLCEPELRLNLLDHSSLQQTYQTQ